jgi:aminoglycoside phosphotransferase (APT) family kinase protein
MTNISMPTRLEEILDAEWLSGALEDITDEDRIIAVEMVDSSQTLAQKVRFRVTAENADGRRRVRSYCIKAHLEGSPGTTLLSEAHFYRELGPLLDLRTPHAYYTAIDDVVGQAMIIMDDIVDIGGRFLSAQNPYSVDTTRDSLAQLARLHASTWGGARTGGMEWLSPRIRPMAEIFPTSILQTLLDDGRGPDIAPELRDSKNLVEAVKRTADHETTCVIHGDTHSGNVYLDSQGRPSWLDWQIVQHGNWATDISYHLGTVLDVETRRAHEVDLLRHYLRELETNGIAAPEWDEAWDTYTLSFSYGYFLWVITQISSRDVVLIHIPRLAAALTDHQTFRRLGVI